MIVLAVSLGVLVVRHQEQSDRALLAQSVATADDAGDPPAGMWLAIDRGGEYDTTPGIPRGLPDTVALDAAARTGTSVSAHLHLDGRDVDVVTAPRRDGAVQAVLNLRATDALRRHVVETSIVVGLLGFAAALGIAVIVGRRAVRPMAHALALQRSFVADASHELRTPLTLLMTRVQLLHQAVVDRDHHQSLADAQGVLADAGRLSDVVSDLLIAADPRADESRERTDLRSLCAEVVDSARAYARERGVSVSLAEGDRAFATVTVAAIRRAVLALIDNAIEHTPVDGSVTVEVRRVAGAVEIAVTDTGSGIDPAATEEVFLRFSSGRQSSSRRRYGLGLALVRDIAVRHDGSIVVAEPKAGQGARLVLSLPSD